MGMPFEEVQAAPMSQQPPEPSLQRVAVEAQVWSWRMKRGGAVGRGGLARRRYWALR
jgi:hypothetical protein